MQAVVLVGGEGTRPQPLTLTRPKPALQLVDRPFISFMLEWLRQHGIDDVIMSCGFVPRNTLSRRARRLGSRRTVDPLHRGGRAARDRRSRPTRGRPGHARRSLPGPERRRPHRHRPDRAAAPARRHRRGGRSASTRSTTPPHTASCAVATTAPFAASSRSPTRARSTPTRSTPAPTWSSARRARADPARAARSRSSARSSRGSSARASTAPPRGLLDGHRHARALLRRRAGTSSRARSRPSSRATAARLGEGYRSGPTPRLGALVGAGCGIGDGASVPESVLWNGCRVGAGAEVAGSILGMGVEVGDSARVGPGAVIGAQAKIAPEMPLRRRQGGPPASRSKRGRLRERLSDPVRELDASNQLDDVLALPDHHSATRSGASNRRASSAASSRG